MILRKASLALGVAFFLNVSLTHCVSPSEIPSDTPIASLVSQAKGHLAKGNSNDALTFFDVAISKDPRNYLTIFQRGATYLSLGRNAEASDDFDKVLSIKPDFEGALLQRARVKSRNADWNGAKKDYLTAGKAGSEEISTLEEAEGAALLAAQAEAAGDWEACIGYAGTAIMVASTSLNLRKLRARCRLERGEILEGAADLRHVLQISPKSIEPHLQISSMLFYGLGDTEKGLAQIRECLRSDPDSKPCSKLYRGEKQVDKKLKKIQQLQEKRQLNSAVKLLVGVGEDTGLMDDVKEEIQKGKDSGYIHNNCPNDFYARLVEMTCEFYTDMNNRKKASPYCTEALTLNAHSLHGLLHQAQTQLDTQDFEAAISTLNLAKEQHPAAQEVQNLLQKAHTLLKRSKTKDYYKILGVATDADDRTIKKAYRAMTKLHHPDKVVGQEGMTKEKAEAKMAGINEAYEVLSDPELRARFDRGDDPNSQDHQQHPFQGSPFGQGSGGQQFFFKNGPGAGGGGGGFKFQQGGFQFGF